VKRWFLLPLLISITACDRAPPTPEAATSPTGSIEIDDSKLPAAEFQVAIKLSAAAQKQIDGHNKFAFDLYQLTAAEKGDRFFAPASIAAVLGMAQGGAGGTTAGEFQKALGNDGSDSAIRAQGELLRKIYYHVRGRTLSIRTALWVDRSVQLRPAFDTLIRDAYKVDLSRADFRNDSAGVRAAINRRGLMHTFGRIPELVGPQDVTKDTRLVLFNTAFFRGRWSSEFSERMTKLKPFFGVDGRKVDVPMMFQKERHRYFRGPSFQMVAMPYLWGEAEMLVLLPDARDGLSQLESRLNAADLAKWRTAMAVDDWIALPEVELSFPKFKLRQRQYFEGPLAKLGFETAFDFDRANFSKMAVVGSKSEPVYLDKLLHEAMIEVDEEGTVAAAATMLGADAAAADMPEPKVKIFNANHPFIFMVRDTRTGLILFMGRYTGEAPGLN
jgi:serpin B